MEHLILHSNFKQAMRRLASTIAIVTSGREASWTGMVATAVTSVSADPPTLLVVVNQNASISPVMELEGKFCVNLLSQRHVDIVQAFSGKVKGRERFNSGTWTTSGHGLPILSDSVASIECTISASLDVATHTVFVGEVGDVICHETIDPLIWVDGGVARIAAL